MTNLETKLFQTLTCEAVGFYRAVQLFLAPLAQHIALIQGF